MVWLFVSAALSFSAPRKQMELLSVSNATQLKQAFFSGVPWLVQCGSKADLEAAENLAAADVGLGAHEVVELALPKLPPAAHVGLLDCSKKLPSGKSTLDRFKLDAALTPTMVFSANGQAPFQLTPSMLTKHGLGGTLFPTARQQAAALVSLVRSKSEKKALAFTKSEQLHTHCFKRKHCALVVFPKGVSGEATRTLQGLLNDHRSVVFGTIDTSRYEFSLEKFLPEQSKKGAQMIVFKSQQAEAGAGDKKKKKGGAKAISLGAKAHRGDFSDAALRGFLGQLERDELELTPLKKAPTVRWRKQSGGSGSSKSKKGGSGGGGSGGSGGPDQFGAVGGLPKEAIAAAARRNRQRGGSAAAKGGGGGGGASDEQASEQARRRKMAEEEEEYLRSMFDGDEDGEEGGDGEEEAEELSLDEDFDEEGEEAESDDAPDDDDTGSDDDKEEL